MHYQELMPILSLYKLGAILIAKDSTIKEMNDTGRKLLQQDDAPLIGEKLHHLAPHLLKKTAPATYGKLCFGRYLQRCSTPPVDDLPDGHELIVFQNATKDILYDMMYAILNQFEDAVILCDDEKKIWMLNNAAMKMDSILTKNVFGKDIREVYYPINGQNLLLPQVIEEKKPIYDVRQQYTTLYGKNVDIIANTSPVMQNGQVIGAFSIMKDWSTIDQLNRQIIDLQEKLTLQKNRVKQSKKSNLSARYHFNDIVYRSSVMREIINQCEQIAKNDSAVMFYGETGTGKELFAQSIHNASSRADGPFLAINCAAIPENLLESLLFGTEKGSYTGAERRSGLFEQADGGTLLLDEINSMPLHLQSKLLRVLQDGVVRRVGGSSEIQVDVRVLSNINIPPYQAISEGKLRQDLFYRLGVVNITIPPLRDRKEDIPILAKHCIMQCNKKMMRNVSDLKEETILHFQSYPWPGNVRELQHAIEHAMNIMPYEETFITPAYLPKNISMEIEQKKQSTVLSKTNFSDSLKQYERQSIYDALIANRGNISAAARELKISRQNLQYRMKRYGIQREHLLEQHNW